MYERSPRSCSRSWIARSRQRGLRTTLSMSTTRSSSSEASTSIAISKARSTDTPPARTSRRYAVRSPRSRTTVCSSNHTRVAVARLGSDSTIASTSASAPQWPASWRAIENQKFRTSSGRGKACTKATYSAIVRFSSSMAMSSTSRMVARRAFRDRIGIAPFLAKGSPGCKKRTVGESAAAALEIAIADAGLLLVELEKFRTGGGEPARALRADVLALGQRARRLHRTGALDDAAATALGREADALLHRLRGMLHATRAAPDFRAAVVAQETGDHDAVAALLPRLFDGLEHVAVPPPLFRPVTWLRRNRPRRPADVVADIVQLGDAGIVAEGDAQTPGTDRELPAIALQVDPPAEPILLRFAGSDLPRAVFCLRDTREYLVHVMRLRAPFEVVLPEVLDADDLGEISLDHPRYRSELAAALVPTGLRPRSA